jgi:transposase
VVIADPGFAPMYATRSRKVKTDRRDARCLAEACQLGAYRAAHRTSDASRHLRDLVLTRKLQVRMRSQTIVTLRSLLRREGLRLRSGAVSSFRTRLEELEVPEEIAEVIAPLVDLIDSLTASIKQAESRVADQLALHPRAARLTTVPGIGPVTAITFHATMDDSSRFASARAVRAYLGLVPSERSSGEKRQLGHITKRGQSELRSLLVEAAWRIVRSTSDDTLAMRNWAAGIAARRGRAIAVVALSSASSRESSS